MCGTDNCGSLGKDKIDNKCGGMWRQRRSTHRIRDATAPSLIQLIGCKTTITTDDAGITAAAAAAAAAAT